MSISDTTRKKEMNASVVDSLLCSSTMESSRIQMRTRCLRGDAQGVYARATSLLSSNSIGNLFLLLSVSLTHVAESLDLVNKDAFSRNNIDTLPQDL